MGGFYNWEEQLDICKGDLTRSTLLLTNHLNVTVMRDSIPTVNTFANIFPAQECKSVKHHVAPYSLKMKDTGKSPSVFTSSTLNIHHFPNLHRASTMTQRVR